MPPTLSHRHQGLRGTCTSSSQESTDSLSSRPTVEMGLILFPMSQNKPNSYSNLNTRLRFPSCPAEGQGVLVSDDLRWHIGWLEMLCFAKIV